MSYLTLPRVRRVSQIVFFALFFLRLRTESLASLPVATGNAPLPYPVSIFLQSDPLVSISKALATECIVCEEWCPIKPSRRGVGT